MIQLLAPPAEIEQWEQSGAMRGLQFTFSSRKDPKTMFPKETKVRGRRGAWLTFQQSPASFLEASNTISMRFTEQPHSYNECGGKGDGDITEDRTNSIKDEHFSHEQWQVAWGKDIRRGHNTWPFFLLAEFLKNSFFFDHVRKFDIQQNSGGNGKLNQDGRNLVQVLDYCVKNNRRRFDKIQGLVQRAFLAVGSLETPFTRPNEQYFHEAFRPDKSDSQIPLHHMGGGVAQLLMAAVALETTSSEFPIFIEEPETNLHPGAQRFLAERLCDENRQVFITTHSPTFINLQRPKSVHKVSMISGKTTVVSLDDDTLHTALSEIGARNSDVLLSDAVVFVEGESDLRVLQEWCHTSGIELAGTNTSILPMRSFGRPEVSVPIRSETLKDIAVNAHIPHLFVLDADELNDSIAKRLTKDLGDKLHIFQKRELENYLLIPRALKLCIRERLLEANLSTASIDKTTEKDFEKLIKSAADKLKSRILLKRIRGQLDPPDGGFFPRRLFEEMESCATWKSLGDRLTKSLGKHYGSHLTALEIKKVVNRAQKKLDRDWRIPERRLHIAPGTELVEELFQSFGLRYNKTTDARRIAKQMTQEEFCPEIKSLLNRIRELTQSKLA